MCFLRASSNDLKIDEVAVKICITCGYPEVHGINHQSKQLSTESGGLNLIPFIVFRRQTRRRGGDVFLRGDGVDAGASTHFLSEQTPKPRDPMLAPAASQPEGDKIAISYYCVERASLFGDNDRWNVGEIRSGKFNFEGLLSMLFVDSCFKF